MANIHYITVVTRKSPALAAIIRHVAFWAVLIGAIGFSRVWFGGAVILDIVAALMMCLWAIVSAMRSTGWQADVTKDELRAWVASGMPDDIRAWKAGRS